MSTELHYKAKYRIPNNGASDLREVMNKIFEEHEDFIRSNQSLPFSSDYSANLKYFRNYTKHNLPLKKRIKKAFNRLSEKDEEKYHYYQTLRNTKPETVQSAQVSIEDLGDETMDIRVRTKPAAVFKESQLGIMTENYPRSAIQRIHEEQKEFISTYFEPFAVETLQKPSPVAENKLKVKEGLEDKIPERALKDFKEASRCFGIGCHQAAMAMMARGFEVAIARKLEQDYGEEEIIHWEDEERGIKKYDNLDNLIQTAEEHYEISNRLRGRDINWSRIASVHFSDGYSISQRKVEATFTDINEHLIEIY